MLNPIRYILEVARTGSLRAAAENLHVAASAISRHIQLTEEHLGTPLFERLPRGMTPTSAGEVYLQYANMVMMETERMRLDVKDLKDLRRGHVRICAIDGIVAGLLSQIIATFREKYPGVTIHLMAMGTENVVNAIRDGNADIGISFYSSPTVGVEFRYRLHDPLYAFVSPTHELARNQKISFVDLMSFPLALPENTFGIRKLVDAACHIHGIHPNLVLETNSIEALRGFARMGVGATLLPYLSAQREVWLGSIVALPVEEESLLSSSLDVCVQKHRSLPPAAATFLKHLKVEFRKARERH